MTEKKKSGYILINSRNKKIALISPRRASLLVCENKALRLKGRERTVRLYPVEQSKDGFILNTAYYLKLAHQRYGIKSHRIPYGYYLWNSYESWIFKIDSDGLIRNLWHQNHKRDQKPEPIRTPFDEMDKNFVKQHYHKQSPWCPGRIDQVIIYIFNHGKSRKRMCKQKEHWLQTMPDTKRTGS